MPIGLLYGGPWWAVARLAGAPPVRLTRYGPSPALACWRWHNIIVWSKTITTIRQGAASTPYPDLHHALNKALLATDATGSLLERALRFPTSVDRTRLAILADALRNAAEAIDPAGREVRHA